MKPCHWLSCTCNVQDIIKYPVQSDVLLKYFKVKNLSSWTYQDVCCHKTKLFLGDWRWILFVHSTPMQHIQLRWILYSSLFWVQHYQKEQKKIPLKIVQLKITIFFENALLKKRVEKGGRLHFLPQKVSNLKCIHLTLSVSGAIRQYVVFEDLLINVHNIFQLFKLKRALKLPKINQRLPK